MKTTTRVSVETPLVPAGSIPTRRDALICVIPAAPDSAIPALTSVPDPTLAACSNGQRPLTLPLTTAIIDLGKACSLSCSRCVNANFILAKGPDVSRFESPTSFAEERKEAFLLGEASRHIQSQGLKHMPAPQEQEQGHTDRLLCPAAEP
jgi:hypothetical protein